MPDLEGPAGLSHRLAGSGEASPSLFCTGTARDPDSILEDFLLANLDSFSDAAAAAALEPQLAALQALWDGDT